jgi:hypothetical protein
MGHEAWASKMQALQAKAHLEAGRVPTAQEIHAAIEAVLGEERG